MGEEQNQKRVYWLRLLQKKYIQVKYILRNENFHNNEMNEKISERGDENGCLGTKWWLTKKKNEACAGLLRGKNIRRKEKEDY